MVPQEDIILSTHSLETSAQNQFRGIIREAYLAGGSMEVVVDAGADFVVLVSRNSFEKLQLSPGKEIWLNFKASAARFLKN
jgi:molybdate/tungstate transport system ATP-binding protein